MLKTVKNLILELLQTLIISFIIVAVLTHFVILPVRVDGSSMYPTLQDGQMGISYIFKRNIGIERFDIVIIESEMAQEKLVKRVIALPNEEIRYEDNRLYINGEYVEEEFLDGVYTSDWSYTAGPDEYVCLGDNRSVSRDSRYYGAFKDEEIVSTGIFVYYPFDSIGGR